MHGTTILLGLVLTLATIFFVVLLKDTLYHPVDDGQSSKLPARADANVKLMKLIRMQNATIAELEKQLHDHHIPIPRVEAKASDPQPACPPAPSVPAGASPRLEGLTKAEVECERKYGLALVDEWRDNREIWCDGAAQLICYPYHQAHKKLDGRQADLFCEATNFVVDFSKVSGTAGAHKPALGQQYLHFQPGSLQAQCRKTNKYQDRLFMPHQRLQVASYLTLTLLPADLTQMGSFQADHAAAYDKTEEATTYLLARDEDCENAFHSTADFMNMLLVKTALRIDDMQVMLFDQHPDGPFLELIHKAYSPKQPPLRHQHYGGKKVMFKRLVFHLESPAGLIFPKVANPNPLKCYDTSLFQAYRRHILQSFDLLDVAPPPIPEVTLILRHRTERKNVGRVMANEPEIVDALKSGNMMKLNVIDLASMSFTEQLTLIRHSNVLVGIHGAGLMFIMFAADEAVLVEIHPSYRQDRHFRHASRMTGKIYMPMRSLHRETCHGSSDNVVVPKDEFIRTMDGALRIARNFDDGISECGLVCPTEILALDHRLDTFYTHSLRKGKAVNTHFPCG